MKTICVMNLKGGVGKTVTADNMAAILAADHNKRVLLIDADHQGNTSKFFHAEQDVTTLREILLGEAEPYWPESVQRTGYESLDIIPADMSLAELDTPANQDIKSPWRLRDLLLAIREDDAYDYVIIDMPPAFSVAARAALVAADEVIVPIKLDAFSVQGMAELLRQVAAMRKVNPRLTLAGVLITMWRNVDVVNRAEKILRDSGVPVFEATIRRTDIVDESTCDSATAPSRGRAELDRAWPLDGAIARSQPAIECLQPPQRGMRGLPAAGKRVFGACAARPQGSRKEGVSWASGSLICPA